MTNLEMYKGLAHAHYVFENMCPKCPSVMCGREPSDFYECEIDNDKKYQKWLHAEFDDSEGE